MMYDIVCSWPDFAFAVSMVSKFMVDPRRQHWEALKWVLRYIKGSTKVGLLFNNIGEGRADVLKGFVDSDLVGS